MGKNKNEFYVVNELKFKKRFISNLKLKKASKINLLLNLHESYSFSSNDRGKKKLILINVHLIEWAKIFFRDCNNLNPFYLIYFFKAVFPELQKENLGL